MAKLVDHFVMTICAPRYSGKTYFVRQMIESGMFKEYDHIIVFCPPLELNDDYEGLDNVFPVSNVTQANLLRVWNDQVNVKKMCMAHPNDYICPRTLIILDDCIDSGVLRFKGAADKIAERGRHAWISMIICSQRISAVSRSIRLNSDYFVIFTPYCIGEFQQYIEQFIAKKQRRGMEDKLLNVFKEKFVFVMLDNTEHDITSKLKTSNAQDFIQGKFRTIME